MKHLTKLIILCCLRNRFIDNLCFHCKSPIHDYVKLQQYMSIIPLFVVAQSFVLIVSPSKLIFSFISFTYQIDTKSKTF